MADREPIQHRKASLTRAKTGVTLHGAPSRTGYQFTGWKCNRDNKTYNPGDNYYPSDWKDGHLLYQITMTAQWEARKYYVTYDSNFFKLVLCINFVLSK